MILFSFSNLLFDKENAQLVHKAVETLPEQRRQIFTLCKLEGKSYEQVAQLMGISKTTVNDHIVKANKAIKTYILANKDLVIGLLLYTLYN